MKTKQQQRINTCVALILASTLWVGHLGADVCPVPSSHHPTIQTAIDDIDCAEINLAAENFVESPIIGRDLSVTGAGSSETHIAGQLVVSAGTVNLRQLEIATPPGTSTEALLAHAGAQVSGFDLIVVNGGDLVLFADGFEGGDLSAWSSVSP